MKCPFCPTTISNVVDSRISKDGDLIRRRRECTGCNKRFTTYERVEESFPVVVKKDGRREKFERGKILMGIKKSCEKRPVSVETIETVVGRIERWVQEQGESEIQSSRLGEQVMSELHKLDEVAYVRFAAVYRSFRDINEFMSELGEILKKESAAKKQ